MCGFAKFGYGFPSIRPFRFSRRGTGFARAYVRVLLTAHLRTHVNSLKVPPKHKLA